MCILSSYNSLKMYKQTFIWEKIQIPATELMLPNEVEKSIML